MWYCDWMCVAWLVTDYRSEVTETVTKARTWEVLHLAQTTGAVVASIPNTKHTEMTLWILKQNRSKETVPIINIFGNSIEYQHSPSPLSNKLYCPVNYIENSDFIVLHVYISRIYVHTVSVLYKFMFWGHRKMAHYVPCDHHVTILFCFDC